MINEERRKAAEWFRNRAKNCPMPGARRMYEIATEALEMAIRALEGDGDMISRQAVMKEFSDFVRKSNNSDFAQTPTWNDAVSLVGSMPSAQPERLTDDDFEAIRIHLNAYKEKLCNQQRWEEAEEYQRIIDRFMAFASAQPEIIRCTECKHYREYDSKYVENAVVVQCMADRYPISEIIPDGWFCAGAERKDDE